MKTKGIILILSILLFSSCIVKSLKPFYIKSAIEFQDVLLGKWESKNKSTWNVLAIKDVYEEQKKDSTFKSSKEDLEFYNYYKDAIILVT